MTYGIRGEGETTVCRFLWGWNSRMGGIRLGIRRLVFRGPTNLRLLCGLWIGLLLVLDILEFRITCTFPLFSNQLCPLDFPHNPLRVREIEGDLLFPSRFANPKSTSLICPSASNSKFSGFKSRYATPSPSCRNSIMRTISAA